MNIININSDSSVFNKNSEHLKRLIEYSHLTGNLSVVVPNAKKEKMIISDKLVVFGTGGGNKIARLFNLYILAKKIISSGKCNLITVQDSYYLALIGWFLARKSKIGLELQIHGFEKYFGLRKMLAKFVIPKADAIRCVSQRLKKQISKEFGLMEEKITVAPIFTETQFPNKTQNENFKDKFIFLTVGRLVAVKNIDLQVMAMKEVVKKYSNVELWIVGDGPERKKLELKIKNLSDWQAGLKLQNYVKLLGWQNNPDEFYFKADAFLLTSNSEGWGMAVVEAASRGLPIIMTDVGCAGELVENEKSGLVVPVNNQIKLKEAMVRIISDENLRKKLTEGAFLAIKKLPSKEETLALYKQSWEKAIKNK